MSMAFFTSLFAFASLLASPTLSTSLYNNVETTGFTAMLSHLDQGKSLTETELLRRGINRANKRRQLAVRSPPEASRHASVIAGKGEFYMNLAIGTPPSLHRLLVDTDTDLIWIAHFKNTSSTYSKLQCSSDKCKAAEGTSCNPNGVCRYKYRYNYPGMVLADLATETFTFDRNVKIPKLVFGSLSAREANYLTGAVGLGGGPLSLVSQLNASKFAHCLPSYDHPNKTGIVLLGSRVKTLPNMITTRLVKNPHRPSPHYIKFQGISINKVRLNIKASTFEVSEKDGSGGVVVDTGSTVTYLVQSVFDKVKNEVIRQIKLETSAANEIGLPLCFTIPSSRKRTFKFPIITLHFDDDNHFELPLGNSFREYTDESGKRNKSCLAMAAAPPSDRGKSSLGNTQLQNTLVVFDLAKQTVAFASQECDKM